MEKTVESKLAVTLENLPYLSEQFAKSVNAEILEAFRDCNNRPKLKKARKLKFEMLLTPVVNTEDDDGECTEVNVSFVVHPVGRPQRVPQDSRVKINKQHQGFFHADFPAEPNAKGMFDDQKTKKPIK